MFTRRVVVSQDSATRVGVPTAARESARGEPTKLVMASGMSMSLGYGVVGWVLMVA